MIPILRKINLSNNNNNSNNSVYLLKPLTAAIKNYMQELKTALNKRST
jgi:hypothetical protein